MSVVPGEAALATRRVLGDIAAERRRQKEAYPNEALPDGTGDQYRSRADLTRAACDFAVATGEVTWTHILEEEAAEVLAETDLTRLRAELVQLAAVATSWIEDIDRRQS